METKAAVDVEYLHCLIHPGFGAYIQEKVTPEHEILFDRYAEMANAMTARDAMIALLYRPVSEGKDYERFVHDRIVRMKEELSQRMLIISQGSRLFHPKLLAKDVVRAREVFGKRGMDITEDTQCIAYGETYISCVPRFARAVVTKYKLLAPATMALHYTNMGVRPDETLDQQRKRFEELETQRFRPKVIMDWAVPEM